VASGRFLEGAALSIPSRSVFNVFHRVLCAGLILNLHVWMGGCGTSLPVSPDGFVRYDLSADQMLVGV